MFLDIGKTLGLRLLNLEKTPSSIAFQYRVDLIDSVSLICFLFVCLIIYAVESSRTVIFPEL